MKKISISFEDISKTYLIGTATVRALNGINIVFENSEFWSIMGPSGSGKSTMLNLVGCLDRATSGRLTIGGIDVTGMDDDSLSNIRLTRI